MAIKKSGLLIGGLLLMMVPCAVLNAGELNMEAAETGKTIQFLLSVDHFWPEDDDRNIGTLNLNAYYLIKEFRAVNLSIYAGFTATYAKGDITQLEGALEEGTLREVNYEEEAFGMGPGILADLRLWRYRELSIHFDASGGLILYNEEFPTGGEPYNFMWRWGPVLRYDLNNDRALGLGYHWMHVSNGKGIGSQNPSYDARGLSLQFSFAF